MSHSYGEGYSTRSDEEGFGGIYGDDEDKDVHGNSPGTYVLYIDFNDIFFFFFVASN